MGIDETAPRFATPRRPGGGYDRHMRPTPIAALSALLLASAAAAPTYPVRQFRPSRVGDAFDCDVTAVRHVHRERTVGNATPVVTDHDVTVHLAGRCTVRAVDARGACTAVDCQVTVLTATGGDGRPADVVPAGAVLSAVRAGGRAPLEIRRVDGPLPPGGDRAVRLVLSAHPPGGPTADDVFPPGPPRAVGESWPIDPARAPYGPATHVAGHATLVGLARVGGRDCLVVKHVSDADGPVAPPPGAAAAHRNELAESTATLPLDPAVPAVDVVARDTADTDARGVTSDGVAFTDRTHDVTDTHTVQTPAKAG